MSVEGIEPSRILAVGPPEGTYYEQHSRYSSSTCLTAGEYIFEMHDLEGDGPCCDVGDGKLVVAIDDTYVVQSDASNFAEVRNYRFRVGEANEEHESLPPRPTGLSSSRPATLPPTSPAPIRSPTDSPTERLPTYPPSADPSSSVSTAED